ncbi:MAG: hypothetical protein EA428_02860 [Spirochaetaceae bacterium]|nr:MAG: hypothetical protein EA428_02860 [Spirochaetaceae bacterium]
MNTRTGFGALLWGLLASSIAWAGAPLPEGVHPGLLNGTRVEVAARSYDLETQLLRLIIGLDGGTRLYLHMADEERTDPIFGISSNNLRAGPVLLNGLHRAVRSPTGHGPGSSVWEETTEMRSDFSFEPSSRRGLELSYQGSARDTGGFTRIGVYALEERQGVPGSGVSLGHESGPYAFEALTGLVRPLPGTTSEDWFLGRRDFPGGYLAHSALSSRLTTGVLKARAAGGMSYGPLVRSGIWGRALVSVEGPAAILRFLGAVSNPDYRAPDGRVPPMRRYTDVSLRIPGEGAFSVFGGIASRSGQVPFSVHESAVHRREFRLGFDYEGQRLRLGMTAKGENLRDRNDERTRDETLSTQIASGALAGDGLRAVAEHQITRRLTADEVVSGYLTVSRVGLRYRVHAVRLEFDAAHRKEQVDRFMVRGASYVSYGDWSLNLILSSDISPMSESEFEQDWSARLELRRVFHIR